MAANAIIHRKMTDEQIAAARKLYNTDELLRMALTMLDVAAGNQRKGGFLHDNMTLAVIRDRVANPVVEG